MAGLEKIKMSILSEARQQADAIAAEARQKADAVIRSAKQDAEQIRSEARRKTDTQVYAYRERMDSGYDLEKKRAVLTAKQKLIADTLEQAYAHMENLPREEYFDVLMRFADKHLQKGEGVLFLSEKDLADLAPAFREKIEALAVSRGGKVHIAEEPADISNGFILRYGGIEENCSFRAIFDAEKDRCADAIARILFS